MLKAHIGDNIKMSKPAFRKCRTNVVISPELYHFSLLHPMRLRESNRIRRFIFMNKMKRKGILKRLAVCSVSLTMLVSATACGKPDNVGGKIAVICKNDKVSFWDEVKTGADDCCEEMGYEMLYYCASSDNDFASQIEAINDAIKQGAKAIVIAPNDPDELNEVFDRATSKGIKIVNINSRSNYDNIESYVGSTDFDGGAVAARNAARLYLDTLSDSEEIGKVAMIGHTAATAELRLTGFRATYSPLLGQLKGKRAEAQAQAAASQAQAAAAQAQAAEAQAAQAQAAAQGDAPSEAALNAAKAAAAQATAGGAPEAAVRSAAEGAARSADPSASDKAIAAAVDAALGGGEDAGQEEQNDTPTEGMLNAARSAAKQAAAAGAPEEAVKSAAERAARSAGEGASDKAVEAAVKAALDGDEESSEETTKAEESEEEAQGGAPAGNGSSDIGSFFIEGKRCGTVDDSYEEAKKLLTENPDIKVMYTTNTNTTLGACKAIEELDLADAVTVVGFNSDEQELKYIKSGILDGTIIQNPYTIGYIGTRYAIQASQGGGVTGSLDTGVTWISAKNINDDDIQLLLYPEKA